jgi:S1-C subfamily serine protease
MPEALVLDVLLVILLLSYVGYGVRHGLSGSLFVIAGVIAGVVVAFFLAPVIANWVPYPALRPIVMIAVAIGLVAAGHALGGAIGRGIRAGVEKSPLSGLDRILGGIVTGIVAALVASMVAFSVGQLGVPFLSKAIAGSTVIRTIDNLTPDPVQAFLAQVRGVVAESGLPVISDAFGGSSPTIPQIDTGSAELNAAAQSVVRIVGNALACGQSQSGTGFVVADDRVVTNAHVVAGVTEPVIEALDGQALPGQVVYFDPLDDLAIIAVPGLTAAPLALGDTVAPGTDAAVEGYPYGGPFTSGAADVITVTTTTVSDIYGDSASDREVYVLAADVREGNSGGPLLALDGSVVGVVFAKSADTPNVGYAMTMTELDPVAAQAGGLSAPVSSGTCARG